jgi:hypothetical protein
VFRPRAPVILQFVLVAESGLLQGPLFGGLCKRSDVASPPARERSPLEKPCACRTVSVQPFAARIGASSSMARMHVGRGSYLCHWNDHCKKLMRSKSRGNGSRIMQQRNAAQGRPASPSPDAVGVRRRDEVRRAIPIGLPGGREHIHSDGTS